MATNINISKIPCIVAGLQSETERWRKIDDWTSRNAFENIVKVYATKDDKFRTVKMYTEYIEKLKMMTSFPSILLENDATPTSNFSCDLSVPNNTDIVYLGLSQLGAHEVDFVNIPVEYLPYNEEYIIPTNMLGAHAIMFMNSKGRDRFVAILEDDNIDNSLAFDIHFARVMPIDRCLALSTPLFYQDDGHNNACTDITL